MILEGEECNIMITVENLGFRYSRRADWIFRNISFDLEDGTVLWVRGPSGSGKSTLLSVLSLMEKPAEGRVRLFGDVVAGKGGKGNADAIRARDLGLVFQDSDLVSALTVRENIELACSLAAVHPGRGDIGQMLAALGVGNIVDAWPAEISGGQRQRAAMVRALAGKPGFLLADEPTSALDPDNAVKLLKLVRRYVTRSGAVAVIVSHDDRTGGIADRVLDLGVL
jgi:putative ABC transport system ATP-binding protein